MVPFWGGSPPILVYLVGLGCSLGVRDFGPWPNIDVLDSSASSSRNWLHNSGPHSPKKATGWCYLRPAAAFAELSHATLDSVESFDSLSLSLSLSSSHQKAGDSLISPNVRGFADVLACHVAGATKRNLQNGTVIGKKTTCGLPWLFHFLGSQKSEGNDP